ncbi:MAG: hypothetical protein ACYS80_26620 [Planctomycetota bacterium]|jgi:hypothetical protein
MDSVVVYKANEESLQAVLGLLRKEGFNPTTPEKPGSTVYRGRSTYLTSIMVPRDEAPGARSVLRKWDQARESEVKKMTGKLAGPFLCSIGIVAVLAVIFLFLGILSAIVALLFVIWLVLFALLANAEKITQKNKRNRK